MATRTVAGWLRGSGADGRDGGMVVEQLEAELALLREENARLNIRRARAGAPLFDEHERERARESEARTAESRGSADGAGEDAWELMTECHLLRTTLLEACHDAERALQRIRQRLDALAPPGAADAAAARSPEKAEP